MPRLITSRKSSSNTRITFLPRRVTSAMRRPRSRLANLRGVSPGARMSAWRTETRVTHAPGRRARSARTIVSASGSSGTARELPPADIAAILPAGEGDGLCRSATALCRLCQRRRNRGHRENATTIGDEPAVDLLRACVEDEDVVRFLEPCGARDFVPTARPVRIARCGEDGREGGGVLPLQGGAGDAVAARDREHRLEER